MSRHLSSIGFRVDTEEEFLALADRVFDDCTAIDVPHGRYLRWSSDCGAELWLQVDRWNALVGMHPHFAGPPGMTVGLTRRIRLPHGSDLDGGFHAWAEPANDDPEAGTYPFVFDSPDYDRYQRVKLRSILQVQVAAFAHSLTAFDSSGDFADAQDDAARFPDESFIPAGLFSPDGETTQPPVAFAILSGRVLATESRENPLTRNAFQWARIRTLGGEMDVVADPDLIREPVRVGGIVTGSFWLSGQLHGFPGSEDQRPGGPAPGPQPK